MTFLSEIISFEFVGWMAAIAVLVLLFSHLRRVVGWLLMKLYSFFISDKDHVTPV
jgi:hypothetical protein